MPIEISEDPSRDMVGYASVPIAYETHELLEVVVTKWGLAGIELVDRRLDAPFRKDYDADAGHHPARWSSQLDLSQCGVLVARDEGRRVGGAVIAWGTPDLAMLEGRTDLGVLWDLRVAPAERRQGVGHALFRAAEAWAVRRGAAWLKVETQNVNPAACRFYARQGCTLGAINRFAYPALPDETQLLWYKQLDR